MNELITVVQPAKILVQQAMEKDWLQKKLESS
jgi:hypothetical protein